MSKPIRYWTEQEIKDLKENYLYYINHRNEAEEYFQREWYKIYSKIYNSKIISKDLTLMRTNKKCPMFLGCHVAERVLSYVFKDVERMPLNNKGFDFICNKGFKVDVKSACSNNNTYQFSILCNKIADYFLLIGFDSRDSLNPQHMWLIKSDELIRYGHYNLEHKKLNCRTTLTIRNNQYYLDEFSKYELSDKLNETIKYCNILKMNQNK